MYPSYSPIAVSATAKAQTDWTQQKEVEHALIGNPLGARSIETNMQAIDFPYCSWECVKGWVVSEWPLQKRYTAALQVNIAAGYAVTGKLLAVHQPY
mmetsp:Transcript_20724/g.46142  ORF Transcript_20724/g.46142 Transcript_20724/m.46142 type:complete len:97 (-) Transcript_20724:168-458(-)